MAGDAFELGAKGVGPLLELNGSVVVAGQFPGKWTPVGAALNSTGTGYEVAFRNTATETPASEFVVWNVGLNGNFTGAATGILSSTSYQLESLETTFGEDLNGDGTTGPTANPIPVGGNGALTEVANQFELNPVGGGTGPFLTLNGRPVFQNEFPAGWNPVGAVQTATGYEVAFGNGTGGFEVWNTDGNGNFTSAAATGLSAGTNELAGVEANHHDGGAVAPNDERGLGRRFGVECRCGRLRVGGRSQFGGHTPTANRTHLVSPYPKLSRKRSLQHAR